MITQDQKEIARKEVVEEYLLAAMKNIDRTIANLSQHSTRQYEKEIAHLYEYKAGLKKILNDHFDRCARNAQKI